MMKTPDEIKKGLERCGEVGRCVACPYYQGHNVLNCVLHKSRDALALIQQLEAQVPRWIPVEEQPEPPEDDVYYCYGYWIGSGKKQAETAEYSYGEWKIANNFVLTHWMPLPEPPKEEPPC